MKKIFFKAIIFILFILLCVIAAFLFFPKPLCQVALGRILNTTVYTERAHLDFSKKALYIDGLRLSKPDGYISKVKLDFRKADISLQDISLYSHEAGSGRKPFFKASFALVDAPSHFALLTGRAMDSIELDNPHIRVIKRRDKRIGIEGAMPSSPKGLVTRKPSKTYRSLATRKLKVRDGRVVFIDFYASDNPVILDLSKINITLDIKNPMTRNAALTIDALATSANPPFTKLRLMGAAQPFLLKPDYDLKVIARDVGLMQFLPYYQRSCPVLVKRGRINLDGKFFVKKGVQNSYYKAETFGLVIEQRGGITETFLGIPTTALVAALETGEGHIVLDCYARGSITKPKFHPGPISRERVISATIDILKKGLGFFKDLKK